jgi:hypothetical protein
VAGDFAPLTIDVSHAGARFAPPALLVAAAIGLGTMDMPVPSVAEWEWVNWKFPRPVRAGETIYARWTLTQKRPPVGGAPTAVVVWRVDVHTADGALVGEGEVGASVRRKAKAAGPQPAEAPAPAAPASRRRRGRRSPATAQQVEQAAPAAVEPPAKATPGEKTGTSRRRRRRRPRAGAAAGSNGPSAQPPAAVPETAPAPAPAPVTLSSSNPPAGAISRVIKRLRRT